MLINHYAKPNNPNSVHLIVALALNFDSKTAIRRPYSAEGGKDAEIGKYPLD
jgi:hypothetical protein